MLGIRHALSPFFVMVGLCFAPALAYSTELLMLEQDGCAWCERWHKEIGPVYHKTTEGKIAPLRILNIHEAWPDDLSAVVKDRFTPTFVLVDEGMEIGRVRGYMGEDSFWFLLNELLEKQVDKVQPAG